MRIHSGISLHAAVRRIVSGMATSSSQTRRGQTHRHLAVDFDLFPSGRIDDMACPRQQYRFLSTFLLYRTPVRPGTVLNAGVRQTGRAAASVLSVPRRSGTHVHTPPMNRIRSLFLLYLCQA